MRVDTFLYEAIGIEDAEDVVHIADECNASADYWYDVAKFLDDIWEKEVHMLSFKQRQWLDQIVESIEGMQAC